MMIWKVSQIKVLPSIVCLLQYEQIKLSVDRNDVDDRQARNFFVVQYNCGQMHCCTLARITCLISCLLYFM